VGEEERKLISAKELYGRSLTGLLGTAAMTKSLVREIGKTNDREERTVKEKNPQRQAKKT